MFVTLAYPFDGADPDETVEVDAATARRLIKDGRARPAVAPEPEPVDSDE